MARKKFTFDKETQKIVGKEPKTKVKRSKKQSSEKAPHCTIPPKSDAKAKWNGYDAYDEIYNNRIEELKKQKPENKPWYFLTKEESITINNGYMSVKRTAVDNIVGLYEDKLYKWINNHPTPEKDDLFYNDTVSQLRKDLSTYVDTVLHKWYIQYVDPFSKEKTGDHYNIGAWSPKQRKELGNKIDLLRKADEIYKPIEKRALAA